MDTFYAEFDFVSVETALKAVWASDGSGKMGSLKDLAEKFLDFEAKIASTFNPIPEKMPGGGLIWHDPDTQLPDETKEQQARRLFRSEE